jgi:hypothetical protein
MTTMGLKRPAKTGIKAGCRYLLWCKIGGEMQLTSVMCKGAPYAVRLGNGGTATYVDVYGYGVRAAVNIKKLREKA